VAVFHPGEVTTQQTGPFFNVSLRHTFLQPVISDGLADIHVEANFDALINRGCVNSNQSRRFAQALFLSFFFYKVFIGLRRSMAYSFKGI
jgi:hypothetical protein